MFFAHGKFFETEEEFLKFCLEWPEMPFDLDDFRAQMEIKIREVELNASMQPITNRMAYRILRLSTEWAIE